MSQLAAAPWPLELVVKRKQRVLSVRFDNGAAFDISCELLRVESPSAQVQGHSAAQKQLVTGKANVSITRMEPVGRYGVKIVFDDGHDSGLYTWDWLYRLGRDQDALLADYHRRLTT
jgi:DUF971 family protein